MPQTPNLYCRVRLTCVAAITTDHIRVAPVRRRSHAQCRPIYLPSARGQGRDPLPCTNGTWIIRVPKHCPNGHRLRPNRVLVCTTAFSCMTRHTSWFCRKCGATTHAPPLGGDCTNLNGPALSKASECPRSRCGSSGRGDCHRNKQWAGRLMHEGRQSVASCCDPANRSRQTIGRELCVLP